MNIQKKFRTPALKSRMVFRLWSGMMMLVLLGIGFMWMFHIYLFEQNYVKAALTETQKRLEPVMDDLSTQDLADDPRLLSRMSHMAGGELILMNQQGKLIEMYSIGHKINIQEHQDEQIVLNVIVRRQEFQELLKGTPYRIVDRHRDRIFGFEMGFPVTYQGETCFVILHNMVMLKTTLDLNRRQLILLTILLTVTASVLALLVSRHFTRPVFQIKDAVDRLTRDDFSARPELKRDDELGQLSDSVEKLGQKLQQVDILRKEVIANVSHELRSPLAVIGGYAELVRDITWKNDSQREEDLNLIISETKRMSEMVTDILDYSQLQAGYIQLNKDWYQLYDILESEVSLCRPAAAQHQIRLKLECQDKDILLYLDALKISQVIRNLLYNAINHTKEDEEIRITIKQTADTICVAVINPGEPIPPEEQARIWERYQRSQHQSGRRLGTGIGLSIVSTILGAHKMSYGVDCQDNQICFWFSCPFPS
ncbi:MAG: HAMP domain-containing histidine kinase [Lachnospiraceae bacterium]|nr:HAMP domain-containing histidine kinase [Lachnospiraceae bacterium]